MGQRIRVPGCVLAIAQSSMVPVLDDQPLLSSSRRCRYGHEVQAVRTLGRTGFSATLVRAFRSVPSFTTRPSSSALNAQRESGRIPGSLSGWPVRTQPRAQWTPHPGTLAGRRPVGGPAGRSDRAPLDVSQRTAGEDVSAAPRVDVAGVPGGLQIGSLAALPAGFATGLPSCLLRRQATGEATRGVANSPSCREIGPDLSQTGLKSALTLCMVKTRPSQSARSPARGPRQPRAVAG